ncbi:hypothetical protein COO60DRAFT_1536803 [Scenedesmus sp. NREL 46B-D3]|nr:hypothetical protein COO60DRAFT_1536803 [Scenedesmus sp. NREL 46B-D3]
MRAMPLLLLSGRGCMLVDVMLRLRGFGGLIHASTSVVLRFLIQFIVLSAALLAANMTSCQSLCCSLRQLIHQCGSTNMPAGDGTWVTERIHNSKGIVCRGGHV